MASEVRLRSKSVSSLISRRASQSIGSMIIEVNEHVYYKCLLHQWAHRTLGRSEPYSQNGVEKFVSQTPRFRPLTMEALFLRDRLKFSSYRKATQKEAHEDIKYHQIKGAFAVVSQPNMLIFGIEYPKKRRYESFVFPHQEDANRVKEILIGIKSSPDETIPQVTSLDEVSSVLSCTPSAHDDAYAIAQRPARSTPSVSSVIRSINLNEKGSITGDSNSSTVKPLICEVPAASKIIFVNSRAQPKWPLLTQRSGVSATSHDCNQVKARRLSRENYYSELKKTEEISSRSSVTISEHPSAKLNGWGSNVIFIDVDESNRCRIVDNGPVYMYCESY
ncbi:unnamed protein product [Dicrocoelium dendriticum]|nr:unnamed protein product [Dicrocoelium dendriticum]